MCLFGGVGVLSQGALDGGEALLHEGAVRPALPANIIDDDNIL